MKNNSSVNFSFRVFIEDGYIIESSIWYDGLDLVTNPMSRSLTEWIEESFTQQVTEDDLLPDKSEKYRIGVWQIYGKATLEGRWCSFESEYDEDITLNQVKVGEMRAHPHLRPLEDLEPGEEDGDCWYDRSDF